MGEEQVGNEGQQQQQGEEKQQQQEQEELEPPITDGDVFCEDDGKHIGNYEEIEVESIPIELAVFYKGFYFIYKLDRKEKTE